MPDRNWSLPPSVRFLLAGGLAAGVNWLARFEFSRFMPFLPAVIAAACLGMLVGFITYKAFVFPGSPKALQAQIRDFLLVNALSLACVAIVAIPIRNVLLAVMSLEVAEATAHAIAIAIGASLNFIGHGTLTFSRKP
ncbi:GtrA family protein [Hyphomicrobium sp.]|uniref:GtrA family protein n=1 Tax=Hyphomicrobium sp. TaxID=82 RepID=UPI0025C0B588|nr:GtrA family protein [Hyphomicrobium sp.]MCC7250788.1 GtrA family protein [Hyphomicrobium sp.]